MKMVTIYSDGGCKPNPGKGGWAAVVDKDGDLSKMSGFEPHSTNNRMELMAAIMGLESLDDLSNVLIVTDSQYLANAFNHNWLKKWKTNGWKTSTKEYVKNKDLWVRLDCLVSTHQVKWRWVRGHAGNEMNELCDRMASEAREGM